MLAGFFMLAPLPGFSLAPPRAGSPGRAPPLQPTPSLTAGGGPWRVRPPPAWWGCVYKWGLTLWAPQPTVMEAVLPDPKVISALERRVDELERMLTRKENICSHYADENARLVAEVVRQYRTIQRLREANGELVDRVIGACRAA